MGVYYTWFRRRVIGEMTIHQERCKNRNKLVAANDDYFDAEPLRLAA